MEPLHPKVKVPAVVGTALTIVLAILAALSNVPKWAPIASAITVVLQTVSGYFTYA